MNWISLTLFAALMQSLRTAGQKELAGKVSAVASTHVRYLFGLPFALIYLALIMYTHGDEQWQLGARFYLYATAAAIAQIVATACLVSVLTKRNFAVGTAYAKTLATSKRLCTFVGVTSVLGSIGWFTAMTLQYPALVKALGQIEFIFALVLTGRVFKEKNTTRELLGMFLIVASVVILMLSRLI